MALQAWDKRLREENEALKRQLMIQEVAGREPNPDDAPYRPAPVPNPGKPPWPGYPNPPKLAHGEHFDEYGQIIKDPTQGVDPAGNPITIPHLEQSPQEKLDNLKIHNMHYHQELAGRPDYRGIPNARDLKIREAMQIKDPLLRLEALKIIAKEA